jgi:hypothetical protein
MEPRSHTGLVLARLFAQPTKTRAPDGS